MPLPAAAVALPAAATTFSGAAQGIGQAISSEKQAKSTKYSAKKAATEQKRKTLADLLNEALRREFEAGQNSLKRQQEYRGDEAKILQNLASQYVQALR